MEEPIYEKLDRISGWLQDIHDDLSWGLKSISDAEKLYDYAQNNWSDEYVEDWPPKLFKKIIGYYPFKYKR